MKYLVLLIAIALAPLASYPQDTPDIPVPLKIGTGTAAGTYHKFFESINKQCSSIVPMQEVASGGSDDNLTGLVEKTVDAAFVQSDTLQSVAANDPRAGDTQIKLLVPLYPEEVHVIALANVSQVKGAHEIAGYSWGGDKVALDTLSDLKGGPVGAWGGSFTTAQYIALIGGVPFTPVQFKDPASAKAALDKGAIVAIIAVGGQPLGFAAGLNRNYKFLRVEGGLASRVKAYIPATLNYKNMAAMGVPTVAARSLLVVKNYTTPARREKFAKLKQCIVDNLDEFREGTGHHPKWADVDPNATSVWPLYDTGIIAKKTSADADTPPLPAPKAARKR